MSLRYGGLDAGHGFHGPRYYHPSQLDRHEYARDRYERDKDINAWQSERASNHAHEAIRNLDPGYRDEQPVWNPPKPWYSYYGKTFADLGDAAAPLLKYAGLASAVAATAWQSGRWLYAKYSDSSTHSKPVTYNRRRRYRGSRSRRY